jgi:zinc finger protein
MDEKVVDVGDEPIAVESVCPKCLDKGMTLLHWSVASDFKDSDVVSSFECPHCGHRNSDFFDTRAIKERGIRLIFRASSAEDLGRRVVLTKYALVSIPEVDLEVPPGLPCITTVEGVLAAIIEGLSTDQERRQVQEREVYEKIQAIIMRLGSFKETSKFTVFIEDPSGNSMIESTLLGESKLEEVWFARSNEQARLLGLAEEDISYVDEVYSFHDKCPCCSQKCQTNMKQVDIPFFKEVIIMCTSCDKCGYKSNDVKTGGAIPEKGRVITLKLTGPDDLSRDILISESCGLQIPEIEFSTLGGSVGGKFTTVEGLLDSLYDELNDKVSMYIGDAAFGAKDKFALFMGKIDQLRKGTLAASLVLTDPMASSYIQNPVAPLPDPNLTIVEYERSQDEDDALGISTMQA